MADFDPTVHDAEGLRERLAASGALDALREDALRQLREHVRDFGRGGGSMTLQGSADWEGRGSQVQRLAMLIQ